MNKKNLRGPQKNKSFSEYTQRHHNLGVKDNLKINVIQHSVLWESMIL